MLIDFEPSQSRVLERVETGLYCPLTWEYTELLDNSAEWHWGSFDWPEMPRDDAAGRLRFFHKWLDSDHYFYEYGTCDSIEQFKTTDSYRGIVAAPWPLLVTFRLFKKSDEFDGGYRWHKNGPYLGTLRQECEYLKDEPVIEEIQQFQVYRRRRA